SPRVSSGWAMGRLAWGIRRGRRRCAAKSQGKRSRMRCNVSSRLRAAPRSCGGRCRGAMASRAATLCGSSVTAAAHGRTRRCSSRTALGQCWAPSCRRRSRRA
ncbi:hypothetical protein RZS08_16515, partial [Arthrospira platensis SPKY1]|nr:hypothetical protein [Arthrospira platensis SPKY1]